MERRADLAMCAKFKTGVFIKNMRVFARVERLSKGGRGSCKRKISATEEGLIDAIRRGKQKVAKTIICLSESTNIKCEGYMRDISV